MHAHPNGPATLLDSVVLDASPALLDISLSFLGFLDFLDFGTVWLAG